MGRHVSGVNSSYGRSPVQGRPELPSVQMSAPMSASPRTALILNTVGQRFLEECRLPRDVAASAESQPSTVYGIDPGSEVLERASLKIPAETGLTDQDGVVY
jgi:hypothetical protein